MFLHPKFNVRFFIPVILKIDAPKQLYLSTSKSRNISVASFNRVYRVAAEFLTNFKVLNLNVGQFHLRHNIERRQL